MDITNPDAWFEHEFTPYSSVADYANEPPRGMTNPPMNLKLRDVLCKDLVEYGLALEVPEWGGGFGRTSASSAPASPSNTQPRRLARAERSRAQLMHSYAEKLRTGRTLQSGSIFSRSAPAITGGRQEETPCVHPDWHQYHPFQNTLRPIETAGPVSLLKTPSAASTEQKEKPKPRTVRFAEDANTKTLNEVLAQGGSPINTEFIRTPSHEKAIQLGKRMTLDASGKRPSEPAGMTKKGKDSGKDGQKDEEGKKKHQDGLIIDNKALDNRMRSLRGNSQLHKAAVADRFKFGASAAAGEPLVLNASSLNRANPGSWSSDASCLNHFHNSAVRIVHPSGLEMLKEPTDKRKKKKKKEDLKASGESGLFVDRYPVDTHLIALRKVRLRAFPKSTTPPAGRRATHKELEKMAVTNLKQELDLGGSLLARVRHEDEADELAAAVAGSGY